MLNKRISVIYLLNDTHPQQLFTFNVKLLTQSLHI